MIRLLLLFSVVPLVEFALLVWIASRTSFAFTLALVLCTGVAGAALARSQGWRAWRRVQQDLAAGRVPTTALFDSVAILLAGTLLITPGVLTDALGLALLVPWFRRWVARRLAPRFHVEGFVQSGFSNWAEQSGPAEDDSILDVESRAAPPSGPSIEHDR